MHGAAHGLRVTHLEVLSRDVHPDKIPLVSVLQKLPVELGYHRHRVFDRAIFDGLVQVLVFGCAYDERIADESCSASTLRRRCDEWIGSGAMEKLRGMALTIAVWYALTYAAR